MKTPNHFHAWEPVTLEDGYKTKRCDICRWTKDEALEIEKASTIISGPKFIKLTHPDTGAHFYINPVSIKCIAESVNSRASLWYKEDKFWISKESPEQILEMLKEVKL